MKITSSICQQEHAREGSVLLFCLGVLALLSLLGTALMMMASHEAAAARDFVDSTRAQFAAESGFETALAKLTMTDQNVLQLTRNMKSHPTAPTTPMDYLMKSSWGTLDSNGDGLPDAAGAVSGTYRENGDYFRLRVSSSQSKLNINDSDSPLNEDSDPWEDQLLPELDYQNLPIHRRHPNVPENPNLDRDPDWAYPGDADYDATRAEVANKPHPKSKGRLENVVAELISILFPHDPAAMGDPQNPAIDLGPRAADALFRARREKPARNFDNFEEVRKILVPQFLNKEQYQRFESFLTLESWQDENVLRPSFQWRINVPPPTDPANPQTAHMRDYAGDCMTTTITTVSELGVPRPGDPPQMSWTWDDDGNLVGRDSFVRGKDLTSNVIYDFDMNSRIQPPDPSFQEVLATEAYKHDRDIYMFSDMQTAHYALDRRSPVDLNDAPRELLEALIRPVQSWYLKEAPDIRNGENPRARAEDWSQSTHTNPALNYAYPGFPWLACSHIALWDVASFGIFGCSSLGCETVDECQHYYYDAYSRACSHLSPRAFNNTLVLRWRVPGKSSRMGELTKTASLTKASADGTTTIAALLAQKIYDRVHPDLNQDGTADSFHPFQTWEEFEFFILDLADWDGQNDLGTAALDFDIPMAHAIIANFNPNSRLNDYNPNRRIHFLADKAQLTRYSAELCFHPMGHFQVETLGVVSRGNGVDAAKSKLKSTVRTHAIFRITSQAQFMSGYDPANGVEAKNFFSPNVSSVQSFGSVAGYDGDSLQSYPEPEVEGENFIKDSVFDGNLQLATLQPDANDLFHESGAGGARNIFVANFHKTLNAQRAAGNNAIQADPETDFWIFDAWSFHAYDNGDPGISNGFRGESNKKIPTNKPRAAKLARPMPSSAPSRDVNDIPGNLFPDGALSDVSRALKYSALGNLGDDANDAAGRPVEGRIGSLQFWVKPNFNAAHSNRVRNFFAAPPRLDPKPQYFTLRNNGYGGGNWGRGCYGPETTGDPMKCFHLYYFARGGKIAVNDENGRLDDSVDLGYNPDWGSNGGRWLPTRAFFLTAGEARLANVPGGFSETLGIGTNTANQSWRSAQDLPTPGIERMNFESHAWTHMAFGWNWVGKFVGAPNGVAGTAWRKPDRYTCMTVNGQAVAASRESFPQELPAGGNQNSGFFGSSSYKLSDGIQRSFYENPKTENYMRFGETSSNPWRNHVADATFDDIACNRSQKDDDDLGWEYVYGRYAANTLARYQSRDLEIPAFQNGNTQSLILCAITWTAYWPWEPSAVKPGDHPRFNDNLSANNADLFSSVKGLWKSDNVYPSDPMSPANNGGWMEDYVPFSVDIKNPATSKWRYAEELGLTAGQMPNYAGASQDPNWKNNPLRWQKKNGDRLCFRVNFNLDDSQILYTSPVFDDISFVFLLDQADILRWELE